jgi:ribokinase
MPPSIVIIGSSNTDMVIRTDHIPSPGETVLGGIFFMNPGGKGANQAVAAARLGGNVIFICKIGDDLFGQKALESFGKEGIHTGYIVREKNHPSGVALITLDKHGENSIVVAPGSNGMLDSLDLEPAEQVIEEAGIILMQLEIPLATVEYVASRARHKARFILNPAPACDLSATLLSNIDIITPNEIEAERLTGIKIEDIPDAERAARALQDRGINSIIITLGHQGALVLHENKLTHIRASTVKALDSTAAGDIFNGALAVSLSEGEEMEDAVAFACRAATISVTRLGAQASAPFKNEINA